MREPIIAIDGPSGAGKSTLSKLLAAEFGYLNLDTGAMYRTVALAAARQGVATDDAAALARLCAEITITFQRDGGGERVLLDGADVTTAIRTPQISQLTAVVAACPEVRAAMTAQQRKIAAAGGVVLEGRDIGTAVFPDAEVKFFLSASAAERGRRRYNELRDKGGAVDLAQTVREIEERDAADSARTHAPLVQAADAMVIDSSSLDIDAVLQVMVGEVERWRAHCGAVAP
ncbi:MAG: (d)CMP kinase [Desulfuromonadaceae bacterium]|nr:(d)CMP kinase [Desulfuromonadaceae bacterium]